MNDTEQYCALCSQLLQGTRDSNNGRPLVDGRVCNRCNEARVIPERIRVAIRNKKEAPHK